MDEAENQINDLEHKEEKKFYQNSKKKKRIKQTKTKDKVRNLWDNFKRTSIQIMGVPEGEGEEQEIENLFKNIMTENFPNLVKEIDRQLQEAQSPKQDGCKEAHSKTHHN